MNEYHRPYLGVLLVICCCLPSCAGENASPVKTSETKKFDESRDKEPTPDEADLPLISGVLRRRADVFASNSAGLFRASLATKRWQRLTLPEQMPAGGSFAEVPEDSPAVLYWVAKPSQFRYANPTIAKAATNKSHKFGIYESKDDGKTWHLISENDNYAGVLMAADGTLFAAREDWVPKWEAKASIPASDTIVMSQDHGKSWKDISGPGFGSVQHGGIMSMFLDPDRPGHICIRHRVGSGWSGVAYAEDKRFQWKTMMSEEWNAKHVKTADFFRMVSLPSYGVEGTLGNYFDFYSRLGDIYFGSGFDSLWGNGRWWPSVHVTLPKNRFEVEAAQKVSLPITVVLHDDLGCRTRQWQRLAAAGHADIPPTRSTVRLVDQKLGQGCWGVRVMHNGKQTIVPAALWKNYDPQGPITISERLRKHDDWQLVHLSEAMPYRRNIDVRKLFNFSEPGEYLVQLFFDSQCVGIFEGGDWAICFDSSVFTIVVKGRDSK